MGKTAVLCLLLVAFIILGSLWVLSNIGQELQRQKQQKIKTVESKVEFLENKGYTVFRAKFIPFTNKKVKYNSFEEWFSKLENRTSSSSKYEVYLKGSTFWFEEGLFAKVIHYVEI